MAEWPGVALPFGSSIRSTFDPKGDRETIESSIQNIVMTSKGERFMLPEFGSGVPDLLHEPADEQSVSDVSVAIREQIGAWEDRVDFVAAGVEFYENTVKLKLEHRVVKDPLRRATEFSEIDITPTRLGGI